MKILGFGLGAWRWRRGCRIGAFDLSPFSGVRGVSVCRTKPPCPRGRGHPTKILGAPRPSVGSAGVARALRSRIAEHRNAAGWGVASTLRNLVFRARRRWVSRFFKGGNGPDMVPNLFQIFAGPALGLRQGLDAVMV
ncbi:MAG: hypothetical protein CM15mP87_01430 [Candidatus Neomarinimicrobiota bacterium]|nr:MAG: hypothetical protein CM15mP87_01430 [Candidatus Neomarinimicrobiota bacterium]